MHEFHLIRDVMRRVEDVSRDNGGGRVVGVRLRLGALAHISAEHLREHFVEAAAGTVAEGATVEIEFNPDPDHPDAQDIVLESVDLETEG